MGEARAAKEEALVLYSLEDVSALNHLEQDLFARYVQDREGLHSIHYMT